MNTERVEKVIEIFELREGAAINLSANEYNDLLKLFNDAADEGYKEGYRDAR